MRIFVFICGTTIVAMGLAAPKMMENAESFGFLQGALTLGGGLIICGLFALKMPWHGLIGAGVLALLGAARGAMNLPGVIQFFSGDRERGSMPVFELGVTLICVLLLMRVIRTLHRERVRRMLESEEE
jgi:hypothetical protein